MKSMKLVAPVIAAAALAVPSAALAHGSVYQDTAKTAPSPLPANPTQADLLTQTRYVVTNHGFTYVLRETNNRPGTAGMLTYAKLPGTYRATFTSDKARWLSEAGTAAQPHSTCSTPELNALSAVLSWQGDDPFYGYIPWQAASAGLEDDPATWLPRILSITGRTLTASMTQDQLKASCEGIGGTFYPADTIQTSTASLNSGFSADLVAPLNTQIATLTGDKTALQGQVTTLTGDKDAALAAKTAAEADLAKALADKAAAEGRIATAEAAATAADQARTTAERAQAASDAVAKAAQGEVARLKLEATPLALAIDGEPTRAALLGGGLAVAVNGPALKSVAVRVLLSETQAKALRLRSRTIAAGTATIGADATGRVVVKANAAGRKVLARKGALKVTVQALSGDRVASQTASL